MYVVKGQLCTHVCVVLVGWEDMMPKVKSLKWQFVWTRVLIHGSFLLHSQIL